MYAEAGLSLLTQSNIRHAMLEKNFKQAQRDIRFLHATPPVKAIMLEKTSRPHSSDAESDYDIWVHRLQTIFLAYAKNHPSIAQIRFIGIADNGKELVRITRHEGQAAITQEEQLQEKEHRGYFQNVLQLQPNQVYWSDIELNREHGTIETPPWPTYRAAQVVYDTKNEPFGFVIINYYARPLIELLQSNMETGFSLFLLDQSGRYIIHPDDNKSFAYEFGDSSTWHKDFRTSTTDVSRVMLAESKQQGVKYLYSETRFQLSDRTKKHELRLITTMDHSFLKKRIQQLKMTAILIILSLYAILTLMIYLYWLLGQKSLAELHSRANYEALIRGSGDAIISTDLQGNIDSWNHSAAAMLGFDEQCVRQQNLVQILFPGEDGQIMNAIFEKLRGGADSTNFETVIKHSSGTAINASITVSLIKAKDSQPIGLAAIIRNVNESVALQKSLEESNEQFSAKNKEMEQFIYTVSHDLKSPLVTISGFASRLAEALKDILDEKQKHQFERIQMNVDHMGHLLNDLLQLSRMVQTGLEKQDINTIHVLRNVLQNMESEITRSQANIIFPDTLHPIYANESAFSQCLQNIIGNAIKFRNTDTLPCIELSTRKVGQNTVIDIKDNGLGIEEKYQQRIFNVFERLNATEGTGVGLAIVKSVMEKHNGRVALQSSLGNGSTFSLFFPNQETIQAKGP